MSNNPLKNIPLKTFRDFLQYKGLQPSRIKGGHEKWDRDDLKRPAMIQTHVDPVPEFVVKRILDTINASKEDYLYFLKNR
jgi:hypothetical protein